MTTISNLLDQGCIRCPVLYSSGLVAAYNGGRAPASSTSCATRAWMMTDEEGLPTRQLDLPLPATDDPALTVQPSLISFSWQERVWLDLSRVRLNQISVK